MNAGGQAGALERAIMERAQALAQEHSQQGEASRKRILQTSAEKLSLLEEREVLSAKAKAEREYRRRVQASEIRMQAELDRVRWGLVQSVMDGLRERLMTIATDEPRYLDLFKALLAEAAEAIEREELVAQVSDRDHRRLAGSWETLSREAVPDKKVRLSDEPCPCTGGVLVESTDGRISVDNTFEGRIARMREELHRRTLERLFPSPTAMGSLFNG